MMLVFPMQYVSHNSSTLFVLSAKRESVVNFERLVSNAGDERSHTEITWFITELRDYFVGIPNLPPLLPIL